MRPGSQAVATRPAARAARAMQAAAMVQPEPQRRPSGGTRALRRCASSEPRGPSPAEGGGASTSRPPERRAAVLQGALSRPGDATHPGGRTASHEREIGSPPAAARLKREQMRADRARLELESCRESGTQATTLPPLPGSPEPPRRASLPTSPDDEANAARGQRAG